jgi:hypothetical protein
MSGLTSRPWSSTSVASGPRRQAHMAALCAEPKRRSSYCRAPRGETVPTTISMRQKSPGRSHIMFSVVLIREGGWSAFGVA